MIRTTLRINGSDHAILLDPRATLLDTLRDRFGLTGTKKGCDRGECGACTVQIDGRRALSCMTLAVMQAGHEITTIEGLAREGRCIRCRRPSLPRTRSSAATARRARSCPRSLASRRVTPVRMPRSPNI